MRRRTVLLPRSTGAPVCPAVVTVVAAALIALLGGCAGERPSLGAARVGGTTTTTTTTPTTSAAPPTAAAAAKTTTTIASPVTTTPSTAGSVAPSSTALPIPPTTSPPDVPAPSRPAALGPGNLLGYIATPEGSPVVRTSPADGAAPVAVGAETTFGAPTTFAVIGDPTTSDGAWIEVLLPTRPNGATGWVPRSSVAVTKTPMSVFIDLAARSLRVEDGGTEVFATTTAIGTEENPTPVGASYVTELIDNVEPDGAYGPYAFGLALHSDTLSEFGGGDGQVGVHGTNQPDLIGQAVSHGCVRLTNDDVETLVDLQLPLGVPVFIS